MLVLNTKTFEATKRVNFVTFLEFILHSFHDQKDKWRTVFFTFLKL